jgi:hypothetical protein
MVGVSLRESPERVRAWRADADVRFLLWLDPGGETPTAFGVRGHPTTVLIDRAGPHHGKSAGGARLGLAGGPDADRMAP